MVDRSVKVTLRADVNPFVRSMAEAAAAVKGLDSQIDKTSDRTAWLAQGILALAPAVVPLGAAAVPVLSGIATQATVAAGAVGTMVLAFNGVGTALKALEKYKSAPTPENLLKLQQDMDKLGPSGEHFVRFLDQVGVQLSGLQMVSRGAMFPGVEAGISSMLTRLPQVRDIVQKLASGIGDLIHEGGANLGGASWDRFFAFLEHDAKPVLMDMGRTVGNLVHGFADLLVAFAPLSMRFSSGMLEMSRSFANWAANVDHTQGFQHFLAYIEDAGPKALDFLGAFAHFGIELVHAYAPIGSVMLPVLTRLLNLFADLADTPVGHLALIAATLTSLYGRIRAIGSITGSGASKILLGGSLGTGFSAASKDLDKVKKSADAAKTAVVSWGKSSVTAAEEAEAASANVFTAQMKASRAAQGEAQMRDRLNGAVTAAGAQAERELAVATERTTLALQAQSEAEAVLATHRSRSSAEHSAAMQVGDLSQGGNIEAVMAQAAAAEERYAAELAKIPALEAQVASATATVTAALDAQVVAQEKLNLAQNPDNLYLLAGANEKVAASLVQLEAAQRTAIRTQAEMNAALEAESVASVKASTAMFAASPSSRFVAGFQSAQTRLEGFAKSAGSAALKVAPLALAMSPLPEKVGLTNASMGAMIGSSIGPWGTAIGAAAGFAFDFANANHEVTDSLKQLDAMMKNGAPVEELQNQYAAAQKQYDDLVNSTNQGKSPLAVVTHLPSFVKETKNLLAGLFGASNVDASQNALNAAGAALDDYRAAAERAAKVNAWKQIKAQNAEVADSFVNLANDMKKPTLSLDKLMDRWRAWAKAEKSQGQNVQTLISRGADPKAIQKILSELGPEAGLALQQMVNRGRPAIVELNRLVDGIATHASNSMQRAQNDIAESLQFGATVKQITGLQQKFDGLSAPQKAKIEAIGIPKTMADVKKVADILGLTAKDWPVLMHLFDHASPGIRSLKTLLDSINKNPVINITQNTWRHIYDVPKGGGRSDPSLSGIVPRKGPSPTDPSLSGIVPRKIHRAAGGLLQGPGTGTSDSIPLWGSNHEYMVRAAAVRKYGVGFFDDLNAMRLAKGGLVTRRAFEYQRPTASGTRMRVSVQAGDLSVTGTLQTPWGPAEVVGIARAAARDEYEQAAAFDSRNGG